MEEKKKNLEIERLRAIAVCLVVICHVDFSIPGFFRVGWAGVDLFFVISGYVITQSLHRLFQSTDPTLSWLKRIESQRTSLKIFYLKRWYRIFPAALAMAVITAIVDLKNPNGKFASVVLDFLGAFSGFQNYFLASGATSFRYAVYWSLSVEEQFYAIFPLLFILAATASRRILMVSAIIAGITLVVRPLALSDYVQANWNEWRIQSHIRFDALASGALIALLRERGWGMTIQPRSYVSKIFALFCLATVWMLPNIVGNTNGISERVMPSLLLALCLASSGVTFLASLDGGAVLEIPVVGLILEYIGSRSYAIYLSHQMSARVMEKIWSVYVKDAAPVFQSVWGRNSLVILGMVIGSELLYRLIERPFMALGAKKTKALSSTQKSDPLDEELKAVA